MGGGRGGGRKEKRNIVNRKIMKGAWQENLKVGKRGREREKNKILPR